MNGETRSQSNFFVKQWWICKMQIVCHWSILLKIMICAWAYIERLEVNSVALILFL